MSDVLTSTAGVLKQIPLERVRSAEYTLRGAAPKTEQAFQELVDSIKSKGILNPPSFTEEDDPEVAGVHYYTLVDGQQRVAAAKAAGLAVIHGYVVPSMSPAERLSRQIVANANGIETTPVQFAKALATMLRLNPLLSKSDLCAQLGKSFSWLEARLKLPNLTPEIAAMVDRGEIKALAATVLATLPPEEQAQFVPSAISKSATEFTDEVKSRLAAIRKARAEARDPNAVETFNPRPTLRNMGTITDAIEGNISDIMSQVKDTSPSAVIKMTLQWVVQLDPLRYTERENQWKATIAEREKKKADAAAEREKKKAAAAGSAPATPGN